LRHSFQSNCEPNDADKQGSRAWYGDETYGKVRGKWWYLYRAIDTDGNLVDSRLSEKRDREAVQQFFKQALAVVGHTPERVTTDGHTSYPRAVRETLGDHVQSCATMCTIGPRNISIIVESKTIEGSSNGSIPCMASDVSTQLPVSVVPLTHCGTISVLAPPWESRSHAQNSTELSLIGLRL
jgi:hypothetical protein